MRGLTGSVDRASPWQRCVDVDGSQKTLTNKATELNTPFFAVRPLGEPERKKYIAKRMQENEKKRVREIKERCVVSVLCVFVLEMIQRWKEDVVLPPTVIFCCAGISNQKCFPLLFFYFLFYQACLLTPHRNPGNDSFLTKFFFFYTSPLLLLLNLFCRRETMTWKKKKEFALLHPECFIVLLHCLFYPTAAFYIIYPFFFLFVFGRSWKNVRWMSNNSCQFNESCVDVR